MLRPSAHRRAVRTRGSVGRTGQGGRERADETATPGTKVSAVTRRDGSREPAAPPRPLVVTRDEGLLDDLLRLASVASVAVDVRSDVGTARAAWSSAPMVVVGSDLVAAVARAGMPRRDGVVLIGLDLDDAGVWQRAVEIGAEHVVFLPEGEHWLTDQLADCAELRGAGGVLLCTIGGRGGAGSSTLAVALATTAARRGQRTMLVDADPLGGGLDLVVGSEDAAGLRWPQLHPGRGRVSGAALAAALPRVGELTVLSWDRSDVLEVPPESMQTVLAAGQRSCDLVVVDLPRAVDASARAALERSATTLVVVPAEVRATAAAGRVCTAVCVAAHDVRVVVRGPSPSGLTARDVTQALGLPLAGELRAEPGLAQALERGEAPARRGRGPLARLCAALLDELAAPARAA